MDRLEPLYLVHDYALTKMGFTCQTDSSLYDANGIRCLAGLLCGKAEFTRLDGDKGKCSWSDENVSKRNTDPFPITWQKQRRGM